MTNFKITVDKGFVLASSGCYSSYEVLGLFKIADKTDIKPLLEEYLTENTDQRGSYAFKGNEFLEWLELKSVIEKIEFNELYLSGYSESSEVQVLNR